MTAPLPNWPEGLDDDLAAAYVGVSRTKFLEEVKVGIWHQPDKRGRRNIWSKTLLQEEIMARYGNRAVRKAIDMAERLAR
jgi:hypothetical protein